MIQDAAQRVLDRAAQRLVGVVSAVYGDGDVVDRAAVCVRYPDIQTASNSGVHDEYGTRKCDAPSSRYQDKTQVQTSAV